MVSLLLLLLLVSLPLTVAATGTLMPRAAVLDAPALTLLFLLFILQFGTVGAADAVVTFEIDGTVCLVLFFNCLAELLLFLVLRQVR